MELESIELNQIIKTQEKQVTHIFSHSIYQAPILLWLWNLK